MTKQLTEAQLDKIQERCRQARRYGAWSLDGNTLKIELPAGMNVVEFLWVITAETSRLLGHVKHLRSVLNQVLCDHYLEFWLEDLVRIALGEKEEK